MLAALRHPAAQLRVHRVLARARAAGLPTPRPHERFKHLGNYLARSLDRVQRLQALGHHHAFLYDRRHDGPADMWTGRFVLWTTGDEEGRTHEVLLQPAHLAPMEGESELSFRLDGKRLYTLTFSFVNGADLGVGDAPVLLIGGMQGAYWAREELRYAARRNGEIAPPTMLLLAASVLAEALCDGVVAGPSNENQAAHGYVVDGRSSSLDYDALWEQAGGQKNGSGFFLIPAASGDDADAPVTGKHRSRTRRRRQLRAALRSAMHARIVADDTTRDPQD